MYMKFMNMIASLFSNMRPIETEPNLNISAYLGTWNQVATSRSTKLMGTGVQYTNVSAHYGPSEEGLSVYNSGYDENGVFQSITGYSYINGDSETKRKVHFDVSPVDGNYWIPKLGPILHGEYQYSIICGPLTSYVGTRASLYVLARNRQQYKQLYEDEAKQWCVDNGFVFHWNEYVETN
jgi:lipocalin